MSKLFSELQFYILQGPEFDYISSLITRNSGKANLTYTPDFPTILPIKTSTILHLSDDLCSNLYSADFIYESIKCSTLKCLENYRISTKICERNEVILSISDKQKLYSYIQKNPKNADSENYWFIALYDGLDIDLPSDYLFNFYLQDVSARIMKVLNDFTEEVSSSPHKRRCLVYTPDINTVSIHPLSKIKAKSLVVMVNHHERSI